MEADAVAILADHDVEGHAVWLWGTLAALGWLDLVLLRLVMFRDVDLPSHAGPPPAVHATSHRFATPA